MASKIHRNLSYLKGLLLKLAFRNRHYFHGPQGRANIESAEAGNAWIRESIVQGRSFAACRHGSSELLAVTRPKISTLRTLVNESGFFPEDLSLLSNFSQIYTTSSQSVDLLACWNYLHGRYLPEQRLFRDHSPAAKLCRLNALTPFLFSEPWSMALEGKKVLVVHPFAQSVKSQYSKRRSLFGNSAVLPELKELIVLKSVQSVARNKVGFDTWFSALDHMKEQISRLEFDVALIGCGAYGLPLSSHVKACGKVAIHLGGVLQLLFGIKGRRWEQQYDYDKRFYNEHWVYPSAEETPENIELADHASYW